MEAYLSLPLFTKDTWNMYNINAAGSLQNILWGIRKTFQSPMF